MEEFMLGLIVEAYLFYKEVTENVEVEEYWSKLATNEYTGNEMNDKNFFIRYADEILDEEVLDAAYVFLLDDTFPKDYPLEKTIPYLVNKYYILNFSEPKDENRSFIEESEVSDINERFIYDYDFGMEVMRGFYESFLSGSKYLSNSNLINETDHSVVLKLSQAYLDDDLLTINEKLRSIIVNIFYFYLGSGYDADSALSMTWLYITDDVDPLKELDELIPSKEYKAVYKKMMLDLIYADLYEDFRREEVLAMDSEIDQQIACYPVLAVNMDMINIPEDPVTRNAMLERFIYLQDAPERKMENRYNTYETDNIKSLKKVNPNYMLDELRFKKKS